MWYNVQKCSIYFHCCLVSFDVQLYCAFYMAHNAAVSNENIRYNGLVLCYLFFTYCSGCGMINIADWHSMFALL